MYLITMFVGKYLQYEVQCRKHEHSTQIQGIYCPKLWPLVIYSFYFSALLVFILFQNRCKISKYISYSML